MDGTVGAASGSSWLHHHRRPGDATGDTGAPRFQRSCGLVLMVRETQTSSTRTSFIKTRLIGTGFTRTSFIETGSTRIRTSSTQQAGEWDSVQPSDLQPLGCAVSQRTQRLLFLSQGTHGPEERPLLISGRLTWTRPTAAGEVRAPPPGVRFLSNLLFICVFS